jgi:hypothetical protein
MLDSSRPDQDGGEVAFRDGEYFCQNENLSIITVLPTLKLCVKEFKEELLFVLDEYGKKRDDGLTVDAGALKEKILKHAGK